MGGTSTAADAHRAICTCFKSPQVTLLHHRDRESWTLRGQFLLLGFPEASVLLSRCTHTRRQRWKRATEVEATEGDSNRRKGT